MKHIMQIFILSLLCALPASCKQIQVDQCNQDPKEVIEQFFILFKESPDLRKEAIQFIDDTWQDGYIIMLLDVVYMSDYTVNNSEIFTLLAKKTKKNFGKNIFHWLEWLWNEDIPVVNFYGEWMATIYKFVDPKFEEYFKGKTQTATIRLDEVRWGGVVQDGIPPLRRPEMISATEANYLSDGNIVFGVSINGDHRAYPKRILAWHEMFVDQIGGEHIAGVYCTLCGTVIAYNTKVGNKNYDLGTSGFLYRSNKLMYDQATQSLWNTIEGTPVIGPLASHNIELKSHSVVTTTWGEWKKMHPNTKVLSLQTGHNRDYSEGAAYAKYFATDELMFNVPKLDRRLKNKEEVLIVRIDGYKEDPLAISSTFLKKKKIYHDQINNQKFVVLTDKSGGNRVFESSNIIFKKIKDQTVIDVDKNIWTISEDALTNANGDRLKRLPYHRIFWFAWYNAYPMTKLVH